MHLSKPLITIGVTGAAILTAMGLRTHKTRPSDALQHLQLDIMDRPDFLNFRDENNRFWQICTGPSTERVDGKMHGMYVKPPVGQCGNNELREATIGVVVTAGQPLTIEFNDGETITVQVTPGSMSLLMQ